VKEKEEKNKKENIGVGKVCNFANIIQFINKYLTFRKI
jgi:hypothetical protein